MTNTSKQWFDIEPLQIMTPGGKKTVTRIHFNGIEPTLHLVFENESKETYEIDCTFNHPLRTKDGSWIDAEHIESHHVFDNDFKLKSSLLNSADMPTFDFEVPEEHCYILESGIVSHNTALLMGGISEGINPDPAMSFTQMTAAGDVDRLNPELLKLMKEKNLYTKKRVAEITDKQGSVQHVDWLTPEEKAIFKTAFEINQKAIIRMASARGRYIDQWQSLNLFFEANEDPKWIAEVHSEAFRDANILGLYYIYTQAGVQASKGECLACQ
jgi:hypothetical protein